MSRTLVRLLCLGLAVSWCIADSASAQLPRRKKVDEKEQKAIQEAQAAKAAKLADPKAEKVRLHVEGAYCAGCAEVLDEALVAGGVLTSSKVPVNKGRGYVLVLGLYKHDADLAKLSKAVVAADTPHKKQATPGLAVELAAKIDDKSAEQAIAALGKVKGVDAENSTTDANLGTISVRLTGKDKVTVNNLISGLKDAGIEAQVAEAPAVAEAPPAKEEGAPEKKEAK